MANEYVDMLRPRDFGPENGLQVASLVTSKDLLGLSLNKLSTQGYTAITQIPGSLTVGTGLTFTVMLVDDGTSANDLGKGVKVGVTVKKIASGADTGDLDANASTEATATITLDSNSGEIVNGSVAIANAALDSVGAGDVFAVRVRRISTDAADTCTNRVVLLGVAIKNT